MVVQSSIQMKSYITEVIDRICSLGMRNSHTVFEKRQIKTLNQISFFLGIINATLFLFNLIAQRFIPLGLNISVIFIISVPIIWFNYIDRNKIAQIYSFFASNTLILMYAVFGVFNGRNVNFEVLILGCGFFGAFIFNTGWVFISLFYNLLSYLIIAFLKVKYLSINPDTFFLGSIINSFATTAFLYTIIHIYKKDFKYAETILIQSEDRLNLVLKGTNNGWWDWDFITDNLYYSPLWWNMLGYEVNEIESDSSLWLRLMHPEDRKRIEVKTQELIQSNITSYELEFRLLGKSGVYIPILSRGYIQRDDTGTPVRVSGSNMDLTETKQVQAKLESLIKSISEKNEELQKQKSEIQIQSEQLAELNRIKDKLFSIIAHDIRSPLTSLLLTLNSVRDGVLSIEELSDSIPDITNNANKILELVDSLFGWAKSQMGGAKVHLTTFDISKVLEYEIALVELRAKNKKINLNHNLPKSFKVYADKNMIQLVVRNLLSNAIKFCKEGDRVEVNLLEKEDNVEISVIDTGFGISSENLKKIFSIEATSTIGTSGELGTGLGLLFSKEFIEKNNGVIGVESELNRGSRFFFTVPLAK